MSSSISFPFPQKFYAWLNLGLNYPQTYFFAEKIHTVLTEVILKEILEELKIDVAKILVPKTKVLKIGVLTTNVSKDDVANLVDEGVCSLVDEVEVTCINDVLR